MGSGWVFVLIIAIIIISVTVVIRSRLKSPLLPLVSQYLPGKQLCRMLNPSCAEHKDPDACAGAQSPVWGYHRVLQSCSTGDLDWMLRSISLAKGWSDAEKGFLQRRLMP